MELSPKARLMRDWISTEWSEKLCMILESMAETRPEVGPLDVSAMASQPQVGASVWSQRFVVSAEPSVWIATPSGTALNLGRRTLQAAGVEPIEDSDAENTYTELLNQSLSALGQSFTQHLGSDASAADGEPVDSPPKDLEWMPIRLSFDGNPLEPIWLAVLPALLERLTSEPKSEPARTQPQAEAAAPAPAPNEATATQGSKTFDLLLDVALPVSISFGRTYLPIKEVLKLNSGSIVELDRGIREPVEVIVNNCVIARGEVVVVEGNYGVRIQQIVSRFDRLRTGSSSTQVQHALTEN